MIIFPSVPLHSFAFSDPKDMHAQLETRDKSGRLEKKLETSLANADDVQDCKMPPKIGAFHDIFP
jgi:hypothetical protein